MLLAPYYAFGNSVTPLANSSSPFSLLFFLTLTLHTLVFLSVPTSMALKKPIEKKK
jgi:hypothetical protein